MTNKLISEKARLTDAELRTLAYTGDEQAVAIAKDYEKLVAQFIELRTSGAPKQVIMDALGLTEDDYSKLASREDIKLKVSETEIKRAKTNATFDANWDTVENLALKAVAQELKFNPDPEYALKAAAVANKAVRRRREDALIAAKTGQVYSQVNTNNIAILNLPKVFMQQLKTESPVSAASQIELQRSAVVTQKMHDNVDVNTVKDAFGFRDVASLQQQGVGRDLPARDLPTSSLSAKALPVKSDISLDLEEWLNDSKP